MIRLAAVLVYTSRAAVGIGLAAAFVMLVYVGAKLTGHRIADTGLGDAALCLAIFSIAVWVGCGLVAIIAERMRGL